MTLDEGTVPGCRRCICVLPLWLCDVLVKMVRKIREIKGLGERRLSESLSKDRSARFNFCMSGGHFYFLYCEYLHQGCT